MPDWLQLIRLIPDELGGWDMEVDRDTWRALLEDVAQALYESEDDEYGEEDWRSFEPQETEAERAERETERRRLAAAFPKHGQKRESVGHSGRVITRARIELVGRYAAVDKAIVHRLRVAEIDDWDPAREGTMTLCGHWVAPEYIGQDAPTCRNCEPLAMGPR